MNIYIPDKDLRENILVENPVPENISSEKNLDSYLKELLEEQNKKACLSGENALARVQTRIGYVYGPLTKLWSLVEGERFSMCEEDKEVLEGVNLTCSLFEQVVTLLGQAFNTCSHFRRRNILTSFLHDKEGLRL